MRVIATALFSGDERLTTPEAMDAYHRGDGGRRGGADPGPARDADDPDHAEGPARPARAAVPARDAGRDRARAAWQRRARRFRDRHDPRAARSLSARRGDRTGDRQCRDFLSRRSRDHRQFDELDLVRAERAAGASGAGRRGGRRPRLGPESMPTLPDRLPLLRAVVDETLRLYPPVPRFDREAVAADRLGEHEVQPGDLVSIWPWIIQRHRKLWDEPDAFDPGSLRAGSEARTAPLPISAVRGGAANVRRRAFRHGRGADDPRHLASAMAIRTGAWAGRCGRRAW